MLKGVLEPSLNKLSVINDKIKEAITQYHNKSKNN